MDTLHDASCISKLPCLKANRLITTPVVLGAPKIDVPIGNDEYNSIVSGRNVLLRVAVDIVRLPSTDLHLIVVIQQWL